MPSCSAAASTGVATNGSWSITTTMSATDNSTTAGERCVCADERRRGPSEQLDLAGQGNREIRRTDDHQARHRVPRFDDQLEWPDAVRACGSGLQLGGDDVEPLNEDVDHSPTREPGGRRVSGVDVERHDQLRGIRTEQTLRRRDHLRLCGAGQERAARTPVDVDDQKIVTRTRSETLRARSHAQLRRCGAA